MNGQHTDHNPLVAVTGCTPLRLEPVDAVHVRREVAWVSGSDGARVGFRKVGTVLRLILVLLSQTFCHRGSLDKYIEEDFETSSLRGCLRTETFLSRATTLNMRRIGTSVSKQFVFSTAVQQYWAGSYRRHDNVHSPDRVVVDE